MRWTLALALLGLLACTEKPPPPVDAGPPPVVSQEILNRPVGATRTRVRHILIGWGELEQNYKPLRMDLRAKRRTEAEAEDLVRSVLSRLKDGDDFEKLMKQFSEDTQSVNGVTYEVRPDGRFEPQFQALGLRLKLGEVGVCQSSYGYHVVQRVE